MGRSGHVYFIEVYNDWLNGYGYNTQRDTLERDCLTPSMLAVYRVVAPNEDAAIATLILCLGGFSTSSTFKRVM